MAADAVPQKGMAQIRKGAGIANHDITGLEGLDEIMESGSDKENDDFTTTLPETTNKRKLAMRKPLEPRKAQVPPRVKPNKPDAKNEVVKVKSERALVEQKKPATKPENRPTTKKAPVPKPPAVGKKVTTPAQTAVPSASSIAIATKNIIEKQEMPPNEQLDQMPTQLRDYVEKERNPQVLMRVLNNSDARRETITLEIKTLLEKKAECRVKDEFEEIKAEVNALKLEGKYSTALRCLAQRQLGRLQEKESMERDAEMEDA